MSNSCTIIGWLVSFIDAAKRNRAATTTRRIQTAILAGCGLENVALVIWELLVREVEASGRARRCDARRALPRNLRLPHKEFDSYKCNSHFPRMRKQRGSSDRPQGFPRNRRNRQLFRRGRASWPIGADGEQARRPVREMKPARVCSIVRAAISARPKRASFITPNAGRRSTFSTPPTQRSSRTPRRRAGA